MRTICDVHGEISDLASDIEKLVREALNMGQNMENGLIKKRGIIDDLQDQISELEKRISELEKENEQLRDENDLLKEAQDVKEI